jgi:phage pi2 protein 07
MKIDIAKNEYRDLLDLLYIAHWVLASHKTEKDPRTAQYDEIIQKFYSYAKEAGFDSLIEYDPHGRSYHPASEFEDGSQAVKFLTEFVNHSFWDELIIRLAERDAVLQVGSSEQLRLLSHEDRHVLEDSLQERYADEFNRNGLRRIGIIEQFGPGIAKPVVTSD